MSAPAGCRAMVEAAVRKIIENATRNKTLWTTDWLNQPVPTGVEEPASSAPKRTLSLMSSASSQWSSQPKSVSKNDSSRTKSNKRSRRTFSSTSAADSGSGWDLQVKICT